MKNKFQIPYYLYTFLIWYKFRLHKNKSKQSKNLVNFKSLTKMSRYLKCLSPWIGEVNNGRILKKLKCIFNIQDHQQSIWSIKQNVSKIQFSIGIILRLLKKTLFFHMLYPNGQHLSEVHVSIKQQDLDETQSNILKRSKGK